MVLDKVISMVADQFMIDASEVSPDTLFVDDLGADSLDVVELTMALEEEFSLPDTPEEELMNIHTVGGHGRDLRKVRPSSGGQERPFRAFPGLSGIP